MGRTAQTSKGGIATREGNNWPLRMRLTCRKGAAPKRGDMVARCLLYLWYNQFACYLRPYPHLFKNDSKEATFLLVKTSGENRDDFPDGVFFGKSAFLSWPGSTGELPDLYRFDKDAGTFHATGKAFHAAKKDIGVHNVRKAGHSGFDDSKPENNVIILCSVDSVIRWTICYYYRWTARMTFSMMASVNATYRAGVRMDKAKASNQDKRLMLAKTPVFNDAITIDDANEALGIKLFAEEFVRWQLALRTREGADSGFHPGNVPSYKGYDWPDRDPMRFFRIGDATIRSSDMDDLTGRRNEPTLMKQF